MAEPLSPAVCLRLSSAIPLLGVTLKRDENMHLHRNIYTNGHSSIICDSQEVYCRGKEFGSQFKEIVAMVGKTR